LIRLIGRASGAWAGRANLWLRRLPVEEMGRELATLLYTDFCSSVSVTARLPLEYPDWGAEYPDPPDDGAAGAPYSDPPCSCS